jgi:hypothetical protein
MLALFAGSSAMATTCTSTFSLGTLNFGGSRWLYNHFSSVQSFTDCYQFDILNDDSRALGFAVEWDFFGYQRLAIDLTSVSLSGSGLTTAIVDPTPGNFSFTDLKSGSYELALSGSTSQSAWGFLDGNVEYLGHLGITPAVPEPETLAMFALGLGLVAWRIRRKP